MAPPRHPLQEGSFDPLALLRRTRNEPDADLRRIMLRMLWLRQRVPEATVETNMVSLDERSVVMSATISVPGGGQGSGHVAVVLEDTLDLAAAIEQAETRALGRALDVLGYVVIEPAPSERSPHPAEPTASTRPAEPASTPPTPISREEGRTEPPEHIRALRTFKEREQPPDSRVTDEAPAAPEVEDTPEDPLPTRPQASSPPPANNDEPELEDVSWTAFWGWARATYQLSSKGQLEDLLGQPVRNETPGQLRQMLNAHFAEDRDDES